MDSFMDGFVDVAAVRAFLATAPDPAVALQVALLDGRSGQHDPEIVALRARISARRQVSRILDNQGPDGSWGSAPVATRRILPTLWIAKILAELGLNAQNAGLSRALDFLTATAIVDGGVSITGRRDGVLPCYTGIVADTLVRAGRVDDAAGPLRWIVEHQHVCYGGRNYRSRQPATWHQALTTRYGGCFAPATSCLLGVVKCAMALVRARDSGVSGLGSSDDLLAAVRELLADRELFRRRGGGVIPLNTPATAAPAAIERWLLPAFPLTYQTDLLEVTQLAADLAVPIPRLVPALRRIADWRLPDGRWPMLRRCSAATWYQPERPAKDAGSYWITLRVWRLWNRLRVPFAESPPAAS